MKHVPDGRIGGFNYSVLSFIFFVIYKVLSNCCIQMIKRERGNLGGRVSGVSRVVMIKLVVHSFV